MFFKVFLGLKTFLSVFRTKKKMFGNLLKNAFKKKKHLELSVLLEALGR